MTGSLRRRAANAVVIAVGAALSAGFVPAPDQNAVLVTASRSLGVAAIDTLRIEARGADFLFGQSYDGGRPWPRFNLPRYVLAIDYRTPALREERTRTQAQNPPLGGGNQPIAEQRQIWSVSGTHAWNGDGASASVAGRERDQRPSALARQTQIWMTPHGFLKAALLSPASAVRTIGAGEAAKHVVSVTTPSGARLRGTLDAEGLVERIETTIPTPVLGDTLLEATFRDYRTFGTVRFPGKIVVREGGYPVLDLTVTSVEGNPSLDLGIPSRVATASEPRAVKVATEQLGEHVWSIGLGPRDRSVLVEFADYAVIVEAPDSEETSLAALEAIHALVPGKPLRYVINTHIHFDHSGGLRTYAAEGATVLTHESNVAYYRQAWANPRTLSPDRLATSGRTASIEGMVGSRTLHDAQQTLVVYHYAGNMHHPGMLMVYLPRERMLIEADSFNPPATPGDAPTAIPNLIQFDGVVRQLALDVERIVPLHGRITTLAEAERAIDAFKDLQVWPATAGEIIR